MNNDHELENILNNLPAGENLHSNRSLIYMMVGDFQNAIREAQIAIDQAQNSAIGHLRLATALELNKQYFEAATSYLARGCPDADQSLKDFQEGSAIKRTC